MSRYLKPGVSLLVMLVLLFTAALTLADDPIWDDWDGRINVTDHFGGDVLYCSSERGCWMLNINGQLLWEVPQSVIDAAKTTACETGVTQAIAAGQGTYGPATLVIGCDNYLNLFAWDEWGKLNELKFLATYDPVGPPVSDDEPITTLTDTDGDGFPDIWDECPNDGDEGWGVDEVGCPIIPE